MFEFEMASPALTRGGQSTLRDRIDGVLSQQQDIRSVVKIQAMARGWLVRRQMEASRSCPLRPRTPEIGSSPRDGMIRSSPSYELAS